MESSWYYARYCSPGASSQLDERANYWLPVDQYIGGIEHAILHLMYFRFYHKLMRDAGIVHSNEPATRLLCQGMVVAETYFKSHEDGSTTWINPADVEVERDADGKIVAARLVDGDAPVEIGGVEKMSKSRNNGVDPHGLVEMYGADTVRLFSVSNSAPERSLEWSDSGVEGAFRFLRRLWSLVGAHVEEGPVVPLDVSGLNEDQKRIRCLVHDTIAKVSDDIARRLTFNTAIAAVMELTNNLNRFRERDEQDRAVLDEGWNAIVRLMAPITPHICEELWEKLGRTESLASNSWPVADESARVKSLITIAVQVNGKLRANIEVAPGSSKDEVLEMASSEVNVQRHTEGKTVRKVILVPDRLLNIVVS
jgi:leucyl-tRNA synthetase